MEAAQPVRSVKALCQSMTETGGLGRGERVGDLGSLPSPQRSRQAPVMAIGMFVDNCVFCGSLSLSGLEGLGTGSVSAGSSVTLKGFPQRS